MKGMQDDSPDLSVLIVSWNDWPQLQKCLSSLYRRPLSRMEVIVIDNASRDGTPDQAAARFPEVQLHRNASNLGHTKAVNHGFMLSRGRYILLLDSDTELLDDCLPALFGFMEGHPEVAMVAPRTFNTDGSIQESARNFPTALGGLFGRQSTLTRIFPDNPFSRRYLKREFLHASEPFEVDQVGSACMFFRRELIAKVGAWDERYFGYWVDTDWCRQIRNAGARIFCLPAAKLRHDESNARGKRKSARRIWVFHFGAWRFYTGWYSLGWWDPRSIAAGAALVSRAAIKIVLNGVPRKPDPWPAQVVSRVSNETRS